MLRIGVLALQGDFAEHAAVLRRLGAEPVEVRLPEHLAGLEGLIIPGGESTTIARLLDAYGLLEPLRTLTASGLPTWGTCAGAIILAERAPGLDRPNLGTMDIAVERNAFGSQVDSFEADLDVRGLAGGRFHAVFIRAPKLSQLGPGVEALASLDDGTVVAARQEHLLATSFHPELTDDDRLHRFFLDLVCAAGRAAPGAK
ncbi:MAG TPA: pyridoxal 5'-phosphate synthase glutaminase subunit PdxT [Dehalococcoidia bacterium]|nr:pyridoxal 5'-phosphate synthase glutaminase subunit PdxT [Dehalococcoidia bacterium]